MRIPTKSRRQNEGGVGRNCKGVNLFPEVPLASLETYYRFSKLTEIGGWEWGVKENTKSVTIDRKERKQGHKHGKYKMTEDHRYVIAGNVNKVNLPTEFKIKNI